MHHSIVRLTLGALVLASGSSATAVAQSSFQFQGDGRPIALSETGQVVLLDGFSGPVSLWHANGTIVPLSTASIPDPQAWGLSADGSTVVGSVEFGGPGAEAARWTQMGGWESLGTSISTAGGIVTTSFGLASDASRDGSIIVGYAVSPGEMHAFRWTAATGMVELEGGSGAAYQISDDGLIISGVVGSGVLGRWDSAGHLTKTITSPAGPFAGFVLAGVSAGGDYMVGNGGTMGGFVWNEQAGLLAPGDLNVCCPVTGPNGTAGARLGGTIGSTSQSGHLGVGTWVWEPAPFEVATVATVWTPGGGLRRLDDELLARGVSLGGFDQQSAYLISSDGGVIAGLALNSASGLLGWFTAKLDLETGRKFCTGAFNNSTGTIGKLMAQGSATLGEQNLTLEAASLPPNQFAMAISSMTIDLGIVGPGNSPKLCLGGNVGRHLGTLRNTGSTGTVSIPIDLTAMPQASGTTISAMAGQTWNFQIWHRDTAAILTSNMTEGVSVLLN